MRIHYSFDTVVNIKKPVVTTGSFDGVHVGHQVIIRRLNKLAKDIGGESVLITFHPHPRKVLYSGTDGKDLKLICSQEEKKRLLSETGLDHLVIIEFTREFSRITSKEFVEEYLVSKLHSNTVVVGYNHHFGFNREGDFSYLYHLSRKHGFEVEEIPEQDIHNESVSSTKIRSALKDGNIQRANAYLDHYYFIHGKATPALDQTELFGHPVFKLFIEEAVKLIPPEGVYAVNISYSGKLSKGLLSVLNSKNMNDESQEVDLIEFCFMDPSYLLEDGEIIVYFHKKIRNGTINRNLMQMKASFQHDLKAVDELIF